MRDFDSYYGYDDMNDYTKVKKSGGLKSKIIGGFVLLLMLAVVGLSLGLAFSAGSSGDNKIRITFILRGEVYQIHYVQPGSIVGQPWLVDEPGFGGWALVGEVTPFQWGYSGADIEGVTEETTLWALVAYEELWEYQATDLPDYIELDRPTFLEQIGATGTVTHGFAVGAGTLTFYDVGWAISVYLDGEELENVWFNNGANSRIRGSTIV